MPTSDPLDDYMRKKNEQLVREKLAQWKVVDSAPQQSVANPAASHPSQPQGRGFPIGKVLLIGSLLVFIAIGKLTSGSNDRERREQQYREYQKRQATMVMEKVQKGLPVSESEKKALEEYVHRDAVREVEKKYSR